MAANNDEVNRTLQHIERNMVADNQAQALADAELERQLDVAEDIQKMGYDEYVRQVPEDVVLATSAATSHLDAAAAAEHAAIQRALSVSRASAPTPPSAATSQARHRAEPAPAQRPAVGPAMGVER